MGKAVRKVAKAYREKPAAYGPAHGQFFMLVAIMEEEGLLPSELSETTAQDRATTTGLLDRLPHAARQNAPEAHHGAFRGDRSALPEPLHAAGMGSDAIFSCPFGTMAPRKFLEVRV